MVDIFVKNEILPSSASTQLKIRLRLVMLGLPVATHRFLIEPLTGEMHVKRVLIRGTVQYNFRAVTYFYR